MTDTFAGKEIYKSFLELNCLEVYKAMHFAYDYNLSYVFLFELIFASKCTQKSLVKLRRSS